MHIDEYLIPGTDADVAEMYRQLPSRAQDLQFGLIEDDVVVFDTETTGFDPTRCSLIEIAAIRMNGSAVIGEFHTFVDPERKIPEDIIELTGITQDDVLGAPKAREAVAAFATFAGDAALVAHNASFDRGFIMRQAEPGMFAGNWIDTVALSQIVLPRLRSHRLADLSRAFGIHTPSHRAEDDTKSLSQLWRILLAGIQGMAPGLAGYIAGLSPQTSWPLRSLFAQAAAEHPGVDFSLRRIRTERTKALHTAPRPDADEIPLHFCDEFAIEDAFWEEGIVGAMYSGYEQREEQLIMAKSVAASLREGDLRVLEAGTGVGKSMAYLVPLALGAKENNITMGVATKTNALMDQLVYHELPRLKNALEGSLSYVALKGYDHYVCLRKLEQMVRLSEEDPIEVIQMLAILLNFTAQTSLGDLDALNIHWYGLPRAEIQADAHDCLKKNCPYFPRRCFLHGARRIAACADIVITNHALLFRDMQTDNGILPPVRHWVIDEAHSVESEARKQLSHGVSAQDLEVAFGRLAHTRNGVIAQIRKKAGELDGSGPLFGMTVDIENRTEELRMMASGFFLHVDDFANSYSDDTSTYERITLWISESLRSGAAWKNLAQQALAFADKIQSLNARIADLISMLEQFEGAYTSQLADLSSIASDLRSAKETLNLIFGNGEDAYVYSIQVAKNAKRNSQVLQAMRIDIGETLVKELYPQERSIIFTSATLATAEKEPFAHFMHALGLDRVTSKPVHTLMLNSSYDYDSHMQIILPSDMPEPNSPHYRKELIRLLREIHIAMGGSVLTLFTNRREMELLYRELKPVLAEEGIDLAAQTRGTSTKTLRDRFLADEKLSLFALKSFWEGFDAPGDTLRCVVIARLPFGRPTDPLAREREARDGRASWKKHALPEAVMDLKQAAGRLIRNSTDKGWLVLADARLQTKNYAGSFLRAMPTSNILTLNTDEIADLMRDESL